MGDMHFADSSFSPRRRYQEPNNQVFRRDGSYFRSEDRPQLPRHRHEQPWSNRQAHETMACPGTAFNVVWQVTTSHDAQAKPTAAIEEAEHVTDTTTNPTDGTPTDSNDSSTTTLLRHSQAVTDKTAPTLSILQNGTTASMPLATGTSERTVRRKSLTPRRDYYSK